MSGVIIRNADKDMAESIRGQRVSAYSAHTGSIPGTHWEALKKAISSDADQQPGVELIIAEEDGKLAGSVALFPARTDAYEGYVEELDYPEIRMLAVAPEFQGKGIAKALITECIRRAKEQGFHRIGLHTGDFMKNAMKLYEGFGFTRLPQYDFEPAGDGIIVRAYVLEID
ncbi:GNAT family N-acetyltransferase [Bacillus infantis]|uniref:GNAT family N-acetyltransferase n=1 Tax=Bacillus infantis TaxID=324767 RepID=UPI003CE9609B